jgi:uncharacterized protein YegP (UPF0339 family)
MATGRFVLDKGRTGKFRFNLLSTNGQVVATSEAYETKRAALAGIAAVQKLAAAARIDDRTDAAASPAKKAAKKATPAKKAATKKAAVGAVKATA